MQENQSKCVYEPACITVISTEGDNILTVLGSDNDQLKGEWD